MPDDDKAVSIATIHLRGDPYIVSELVFWVYNISFFSVFVSIFAAVTFTLWDRSKRNEESHDS